MGDWAKPTAFSLYVPDFLNELNNKDFDAGSMCFTAPTNPPVGLMRYNRTTNIFEEWDGAVWNAKLIGVTGGGTGGGDSATARANLGIGSLGTQGAGAVAITGGTISGITSLSLTGSIAFNSDDAYDIGTLAIRPRKVYVRSALVIPSGVNKYATS